MNPHDLAGLSPEAISDVFRKSINENELQTAQDAFSELESRFDQLCGSKEGSRQFLNDYLPLTGSPEVRALHIPDPLARCAAKLEHLLELAGMRARAVDEEAILRQIVDSRERGQDLLNALAAASAQGLQAGELASRLKISPQNLSPILSAFHAHGLLDRTRRGRHVYVTLTRRGRSLASEPKTEPVHVEYKFLIGPMRGRLDMAAAA